MLTIKDFSTLLLICCIAGSSYAKQLPDLGSDTKSIMSPKNEIVLGKAWLAGLRSSGKVSYDPIINAYLTHLGRKLALYSGIKDYPLNFFAVADDTFNAFAFFGGNVGIHEGLITSTNNESELAAVMAHEIAHIAQDHMLRQMAEQRKLLPITMAEALAAIAIGNPDLILPILAGHGQQIINFTREHEKEADRFGIQIMAKAGFDPQSMPALFQHMSQQSRYDTKVPEYLLTHPVYESRIADARHRADSFNYQQAPNSLNYYLIKARIQALTSQNIHDKLTKFEDQLANKRYENADACAYGYALALTLNQDYKPALTILEKLVSSHPKELILQLALADLEMQAGQNSKATARMEQLISIFPDDLALTIQYTEQLLATNQPAAAKKWLLKVKDKYPDEPVLYYNLARIESSLGNSLGMYEANTEWHLLHGDYRSALTQLEMATATTQDQRQQDRIQQRKKQIAALLVQHKTI